MGLSGSGQIELTTATAQRSALRRKFISIFGPEALFEVRQGE